MLGFSSFAAANALSARWLLIALAIIYKLLPTAMLVWYAIHVELRGMLRAS